MFSFKQFLTERFGPPQVGSRGPSNRNIMGGATKSSNKSIMGVTKPKASLKFGMRTPNLTKSFKARTSLVRHLRSMIRVGKGYGFVTNPKKALYNRAYKRTTVSFWHGLSKAFGGGSK
jgi:hypothetical protein